jgi:hypothetical protein
MVKSKKEVFPLRKIKKFNLLIESLVNDNKKLNRNDS